MDEVLMTKIALTSMGFILAFFGQTVYKLSIRVAGFIIGGFLGIMIVKFITDALKIYQNQEIIAAAGGLLLGLLGAFAIRKWIKVLLFLAGGITGFMVGQTFFYPEMTGTTVHAAAEAESAGQGLHSITDMLGNLNWQIIAAALVGGILAVLLERFFVILFSSFWGARMIESVFAYQYVFPVVLFVGILFQVLSYRMMRQRRRLRREAV